MTEEEQEKLYELLFKDTKNKLETIIERQQKEIEDLQIIADDIKGHNIVYTDTPEFEDKFISKDKIRELLNRYSKESFIAKVDLEELIEE